jgi:predicted permease
VPLAGDYWNELVHVPGSSVSAATANFNQVGPGFFRTMGTPLLAGRDFDDRDRRGGLPVAIVTEAFARKFLNGASPIGRSVQIDNQGGDTTRRYEIVGLVRDTKYGQLRDEFGPIVFLSIAQDDDPRPWVSIVVRSDLPLGTLRPSLSAAITGASPDVDILFRPMQEIVRDGLLRERLMASLSAFFGFLAAVLAMVGLYGVVSFMVVRRRNEIGVRMALGATRRDIVWLVLREAGSLLAVGLGIGIVLAVGAASLARSLLFGLQPFDPATLAMAAVGLAAVAAAASFFPAHRASTLDPVSALRED